MRLILAAFILLMPLAVGSRAEPESTREVTVPIVNVHVGGDDSRADKVVYRAPPGFQIDTYRVVEKARGGDANYSVSAPDDRTVAVVYQVKSRIVRGPLGLVLDTKTAFLNLDLAVTLRPIATASAAPASVTPAKPENITSPSPSPLPLLNLLGFSTPYIIGALLCILVLLSISSRRLRRGMGRALVRVGQYLGNPPD